MKKSFIKISAVIMVLVLVFSCIPFVSAGNVTPVIIVTGFGATTLTCDGEIVFPPTGDALKEAFGVDELNAEVIVDLFKKWTAEKGFRDQLASAVSNILEPISTKADGTLVYELEPIVKGAEHTSLKAFTEEGNLDYVPYTGSEFLDMESIGDRIGDENVFNYTYNWCNDYNDTTEDFKGYIEEVLEITGAEKVSIYAISQGCLVVGQYLYKYSNLGRIDNIVFDTPVLGGTTFVSDVFRPGETHCDFDIVFRLLTDVLHTELDLSFLTGILEGEYFVKMIRYGKDSVILPKVYTGLAFWEMMPPEDFNELYQYWLDETENAQVIEKIREFQSGFISNITSTFKKAEEYGTTVSIKACTGFDICTCSEAYSDAIVDMKYSCGATCAPFGQKFSDTYTQAVNTGKNQISPDRTIDLSTGYWPDRTWVFNDLLHGQVEWCRKSLKLVETLLYTHDLKDAYSSYEFPQFMESTCPSSDITASFVQTNSGFADISDGQKIFSYVITNTSLKDTIIIRGINTDKVSVDFNGFCLLLPGKSLTINIDCPENCYDTLTVEYSRLNNPVKKLTKSFGIAVTDNYSGQTVTDNAENNSSGNFFAMLLNMLKSIFSFAANTVALSF